MISYAKHYLTQNDIDAVIDALNSVSITQGEVTKNFGCALAGYTGAKYGLVVNNGTTALQLGLAALGIGIGDEVITTPITFCATANAVLLQGGIVRFVDINEKTINIDPELIEGQITERTKAILPVDFRGHPADLFQIKEIADKYNLKVLEDGAHSLGSTYLVNGKEFKCGDGVHANATTFSFHPAKHITTGEGGAVMTNDKCLFEKLIPFSEHGLTRRGEIIDSSGRKIPWAYDMEHLGFNCRMTDFQAALGLSQLARIKENKSKRRAIVEYYNERFSVFEELILPYEQVNVDSNFHLYILQVSDSARFDRYELFSYLRSKGYFLQVHYSPIHLLSYYRNNFQYKLGDYPISERYYDRAITMPLYPGLSDLEVECIANDIRKFIIR